MLGQAFLCAEKREGGWSDHSWLVEIHGVNAFSRGLNPGHQPYPPPQSACHGLVLTTVQPE